MRISKAILSKLMKQTATLYRDGLSYSIICMIQAIPTVEVAFPVGGVMIGGRTRIFFLPEYKINGTLTPKKGDEIEIEGKRYLIEEIYEHRLSGKVDYLEAELVEL